MKHRILITLFCAITVSQSAVSAPGCMDNSTHLKSAHDYKEYRIVACNCPCNQYKLLADRGQCVKCRHFRDIKPVYTIARKEFYHHAAAATQAVEKRMHSRQKDNPFARVFNAYPLIN